MKQANKNNPVLHFILFTEHFSHHTFSAFYQISHTDSCSWNIQKTWITIGFHIKNNTIYTGKIQFKFQKCEVENSKLQFLPWNFDFQNIFIRIKFRFRGHTRNTKTWRRVDSKASLLNRQGLRFRNISLNIGIKYNEE